MEPIALRYLALPIDLKRGTNLYVNIFIIIAPACDVVPLRTDLGACAYPPLDFGGCVGNVVDDSSVEDEASVKQHKAKPYLFLGRSGADAMERQRNGVRACPAHREWRAALLWPSGL